MSNYTYPSVLSTYIHSSNYSVFIAVKNGLIDSKKRPTYFESIKIISNFYFKRQNLQLYKQSLQFNGQNNNSFNV